MRLPGKMLRPIGGKPLILHTLAQASRSKLVTRAIAATDDHRIFDVVRSAGFEAVMTSAEHASGSDRLAEVAASLPTDSVVVNVQGDEPLISPDTIDLAVEALLRDPDAAMSTVCEPISSLHGELLNGNVVKVVVSDHGYALYFSRSPMPFPRDASLRHGGDPGRAIEAEPELMQNFRKHIGLYVYRREYLLRFTALPQTKLEQIESLEQLRALEDGAKIRVVQAAHRSIGVDTEDDFERVANILEAGIDIRPAVREDLPAVAIVHVDSWRRSFEGLVPSDFLGQMSVERRLEAYANRECGGDYRMFAAELEGRGIVGFADCGVSSLRNDYDAQIFSFYLLPEFQRKGFGERLFRRCIRQLQAFGHRSLCLDSLAVSPYRRFYEKMGGRIIGHDSHRLSDQDFETVIYGWDDMSTI